MQKEYLKSLDGHFEDLVKENSWNLISSWSHKNISLDDYMYIFAGAFMTDEFIKSNSLLKGYKSIETLFRRIDEEYFDLVYEIKEKFNENELAPIVFYFDSFLENKGSIHRDEMDIQEGLRNIVYRILDIKDNDILLQPYSSYGSFIADYLVNFRNSKIIAMDRNKDKMLSTLIKSSIMPNANNVSFILGDYLTSNINKLGANKIFSIPPLNKRTEEIDIYGDKNLNDIYQLNKFGVASDWAYILKAITNKTLERAVFILSSEILSRKRKLKKRKYLFDNGYIEAILELPPNLIRGISITTNLVVISKGNTHINMVDASEFYKKTTGINIIDDECLDKIIESYEGESEYSKKVSIDELKECDYSFLPKRYLNDAIKVENSVCLKEVANIKQRD